MDNHRSGGADMDSDSTRSPGDGPVSVPASFLVLLEAHQALDEVFLTHQEALLDFRVPLALARLDAFERGLRAHIRLEEDTLLPIYERAGPIPGEAVRLFLLEHRKMLQLLAQFRLSLAELERSDGGLKRATFRLLDYETMFKHLSRHHDLREQNILYPTLDRVATEQERRAVLASSSLAAPVGSKLASGGTPGILPASVGRPADEQRRR